MYFYPYMHHTDLSFHIHEQKIDRVNNKRRINQKPQISHFPRKTDESCEVTLHLIDLLCVWHVFREDE